MESIPSRATTGKVTSAELLLQRLQGVEMEELTELEKLYLNYLDMTTHLEGERLTFDEYKESRRFVQGMITETDAEHILKAESERIRKGE